MGEADTVMAIDPGLCTGWARVTKEAGELVACGLLMFNHPTQPEEPHFPIYGSRLVVEAPQIYRASKQKGDPNDLVTVALIAGRFVQMACDSMMAAEIVKPRDWKGQTPKKTHNKWVLAALTPQEKYLLDWATRGNKSKAHNVIDAIGLAFWAVGRKI